MSSLLRAARVLVGVVLLGVAPLAARGQTPTLISQTTASQYGLHRAWATQLHVAAGMLHSLSLHGGILLAQSEDAGIEAVDAETGRTLWATKVGNPMYPSMPAASNAHFVALTNGATLYALDRTNGGILWQRELKSSPSAGPAVTEERVYVPMLNGSLESYKFIAKTVLDRTPLLFFGRGAALAAPLTSEKSIMWGTESGNVYVDGLTSSSNRIRFHVGGPIVGRLAHRAPRIFFVSEDAYAYAIGDSSGDKLWQYYAGSPIRKPPVSIGDAVYVTPDAGGLVCINGATGQPRWLAAGITQFVAASPTRIYASDISGQLWILDAKSGSRLASLATQAMPVKMANAVTDRLYLATASGQLECLREQSLLQPVSHLPPPPKKEEKGAARKKGEAAKPPAE